MAWLKLLIFPKVLHIKRPSFDIIKMCPYICHKQHSFVKCEGIYTKKDWITYEPLCNVHPLSLYGVEHTGSAEYPLEYPLRPKENLPFSKRIKYLFNFYILCTF